MNSDEILGFFSMDEDELLERVDEYTLYSFYLKDILGEEPIIRKGYNSPVRLDGETIDDNPSFGIYYTDKWVGREFMWIDQARGRKGDIFGLVKLLFGFDTRMEAVKKIRGDFGLGPDFKAEKKIVLYTRKEKVEASIRIASREFRSDELDWWSRFNCDRNQLKLFNTTTPKYYWTTDVQQHPFYPKDMTFAYRILDRYQIYRPFADKKFKFRNDFNENCIPGAAQLQFRTDTLLITKAMKDTICIDSFKEFDVLAGRGENVMIPDRFMQYLLTRFKYIITFMDNDGKNHTASKYQEQYGAMSMAVPLDPQNSKDPAGACETYSARWLLKFMKESIWLLKQHLQDNHHLIGRKVTVKGKDTLVVSKLSIVTLNYEYFLILFGHEQKLYINVEDIKRYIYVHT